MAPDLPRLTISCDIHQQLTPRLAELTNEWLRAAVDSLLWSDTVPPDYFDDEIGPAFMDGLTAFLQAIAAGHTSTKAEVANFVLPVIERHFVDRIPLTALLAALHTGAAKLWLRISEITPVDDGRSIAALGADLIHLFGTISVVMTEAYQDADLALRTQERDAQRALCSALVHGEPVEGLAAAAGIPLSEGYHVFAMQTGAAAEQRNLGGAFVARRRQRLAQQILDEFGLANVLSNFDGCTGTVLIPPTLVDSLGGSNAANSRRLMDAISERLEVDIYVAHRFATIRSDIPAAVREATEVARLARQLRRPVGLYRLEDVMFEYQATRPGPVRDALAQRIAPLAQHPHLLQTLQLQLKHGADRKAAAAELFVHPNTFSYRLRRIAELTGIDPGDPDGSRLLAAALTIHLVDGDAEDIGAPRAVVSS